MIKAAFHAGRLATPAIIFFTLLVFSPALGNGFVNLDDETYVTANPHVQGGLTLQNLVWAATTQTGSNWHPLTWLSLQLDSALFGSGPRGFHATSVLIHAITAALFFHLLLALTGELWPGLLAALLFAWHPLRVESVAWIAERKDVLAGLFWVLTTQAYVRSVQKPSVAARVLTIFWFVCGVLSKPMVVTLPFALILLNYWPLARLQPGRHAVRFSRILQPLLPLFILAALSCVLTIRAQHDALLSSQQLPVSIRFWNAFLAIGRYLAKFVWPVPLIPFYPYPTADGFATKVAVSIGFLLLVTAWVWQLRRTRPYLLVGWLWFLGTLVPVLGLVQVGVQSIADRYTYIPSMGLAIMTAWGLRDVARAWPPLKAVIAAAATAALVLFAQQTITQISYWHDSDTLWRRTIAVDPANFMAHYWLGLSLANQAEEASPGTAERKLEEAVSEYRDSIRIRGNQPQPHYALARALERQHRDEEAAASYRAAIQCRPDYAEAYNNLGGVYTRLRQFDAAMACYQQALVHDPDLEQARENSRRLSNWLKANPQH
jgi:tetratricopeptide (TPR) repeat protein